MPNTSSCRPRRAAGKPAFRTSCSTTLTRDYCTVRHPTEWLSMARECSQPSAGAGGPCSSSAGAEKSANQTRLVSHNAAQRILQSKDDVLKLLISYPRIVPPPPALAPPLIWRRHKSTESQPIHPDRRHVWDFREKDLNSVFIMKEIYRGGE